jgi:hypothetical protein
VLTFHRATTEFARGEWARVVSVEKEKLVVEKSGGGKVNLTRKQSGCYVSASRGREKIKIYTDNLERLGQSLTRSGDRLSALEWLQKAQLQEEPAVRARIRPA